MINKDLYYDYYEDELRTVDIVMQFDEELDKKDEQDNVALSDYWRSEGCRQYSTVSKIEHHKDSTIRDYGQGLYDIVSYDQKYTLKEDRSYFKAITKHILYEIETSNGAPLAMTMGDMQYAFGFVNELFFEKDISKLFAENSKFSYKQKYYFYHLYKKIVVPQMNKIIISVIKEINKTYFLKCNKTMGVSYVEEPNVFYVSSKEEQQQITSIRKELLKKYHTTSESKLYGDDKKKYFKEKKEELSRIGIDNFQTVYIFQYTYDKPLKDYWFWSGQLSRRCINRKAHKELHQYLNKQEFSKIIKNDNDSSGYHFIKTQVKNLITRLNRVPKHEKYKQYINFKFVQKK